MGLYGDKKDYQEMVKENIEKAKVLNLVPPEKYDYALKLLEKKDEIIKENGFFASIKLNIINHKIRKLQNL